MLRTLVLAGIIAVLSHSACADTMHTTRMTIFCSNAVSTKMLDDLDDPRRGTEWFGNAFQQGKCMWFAANVTLEIISQNDDVSQVKFSEVPEFIYVKDSALASGVGTAAPASPTKLPDMPQFSEGGLDRRIDEVHARLRITPAQQPLFDVIAQELRKAERDDYAALTQMQHSLPGVNAVDRMRLLQQAMHLATEAIVRRLQALSPLYDVLSPEQKAQADQLF